MNTKKENTNKTPRAKSRKPEPEQGAPEQSLTDERPLFRVYLDVGISQGKAQAKESREGGTGESSRTPTGKANGRRRKPTVGAREIPDEEKDEEEIVPDIFQMPDGAILTAKEVPGYVIGSNKPNNTAGGASKDSGEH
jgi:hypothetical protein